MQSHNLDPLGMATSPISNFLWGIHPLEDDYVKVSWGCKWRKALPPIGKRGRGSISISVLAGPVKLICDDIFM